MIAIGGGAGGLITAIVAGITGGKAALIERNLLGGDCLNTGCIPSKAILQSSKVAHYAKTAGQYGIDIPESAIDINFPKVMERVRKLRAEVSSHDSAERMTK